MTMGLFDFLIPVEMPPNALGEVLAQGVVAVRLVIDENRRREEERRRRAEQGGRGVDSDVMYKTPGESRSPEFAFARPDSQKRRPPDLHAPVLSFSARLVKYVRERCNGRPPVAYKRAGIDRKLYSKIVSNDRATVSKQTALQLAVGLQLNRRETDEFLHAAGYALSPTIPLDCAFAYCIEHGVWNILDVNQILVDAGLRDLGVCF